MKEPIVTYRPHPDYRYWLYEPEGEGMTYYRTQEDRDAAGKKALGWNDDAERVAAGVVTHCAQWVDTVMRAGDASYWCGGNYSLEPLAPTAGENHENLPL